MVPNDPVSAGARSSDVSPRIRALLPVNTNRPPGLKTRCACAAPAAGCPGRGTCPLPGRYPVNRDKLGPLDRNEAAITGFRRHSDVLALAALVALPLGMAASLVSSRSSLAKTGYAPASWSR